MTSNARWKSKKPHQLYLEPQLPPVLQQMFNATGVDDSVTSDPVALSSTVISSFPFMLDALSEAEKIDIGHALQETVPICIYDGAKCDLNK